MAWLGKHLRLLQKGKGTVSEGECEMGTLAPPPPRSKPGKPPPFLPAFCSENREGKFPTVDRNSPTPTLSSMPSSGAQGILENIILKDQPSSLLCLVGTV